MTQKRSLFVRLLTETFWVVVAVAIVAGGVLGFRYLGENREVVEADTQPRPVALVETVALEPLSGPLPIRGEGFVQPFRQLDVSAQVSGRITYLHPAIVARGRFGAGEVLVRLEDSAQRAALSQTAANIAATEARLELNATELDRAEALLAREVISQTQVDTLLSNRQELLANLDGLIAARESAEIAVAEREIAAPFDGAVISRAVEVGDVVSAGQPISEVFTETDLEIEVPVRQADAALIPGLFTGDAGSATVDIPFAGFVFRWNAEIARVSPQLDPITRTLTVTLRLTDQVDAGGQTLGGQEIASGAPPALINAFATVVIDGSEPDATFRVPSTALRGGDTLWLYDDGELALLPVGLVHVDGEASYVRAPDADPATRVVTSALAAPVPGMPLRDAGGRAQAALTGTDQ